MRRTILVDIETVVDPRVARRVAGDESLSDEEAVRRVAPLRPDGSETFPKPLYHRVIEIGLALLDAAGEVRALKALRRSDEERELLECFWEGLASQGAGVRLATFNGRRFDLPVLIQRALLNGVSPRAWWSGDYRNRYRDAHVDLMDFLAEHGAATVLSQHEMAVMLGVPGKLGVDGADVAGLWASGRHQDVAAYATCDVATLTLCYGRLGVHSGWCTPEEAFRIETGVRRALEGRVGEHPLYRRFLDQLG